MIEIGNFEKDEIKGGGAAAWLDHLLPNKLPKVGRMVLTPMLNEAGKLIGDFTLARLAANEFMIFGSGLAEDYHMRWFLAHLPESGVSVRSLGLDLVGIQIAGPRSRALLAKLVDRDVGQGAFRFMDIARMDVGMLPAIVGRVSYTGDLGYEIWVKPEHERALLLMLEAEGAELGLQPFGSRAFNALRLEKSFGSWSREYRPIYTPFEAGLDRFVALEKGPFIGSEALKHSEKKLQLSTFVIEATDADVLGDEPILLGDAVVGWVTSGGYAHGSKASVALGYVKIEAHDPAARYRIEVLGEPRAAHIILEPLFDPKSERMRG
jgi:dimethylglycine dehydrogenase